MPVPATIDDLTTSEATNSPLDSETVTATTRPSDYLRAHAAIIKTLQLAMQLPVGSVYVNASDATNPATLLGYGTWTAFGSGRVMVGLDAADASFDLLGETGGSKDAVAVAHTHTFSAMSGGQSADHTHTGYTDTDGAHTHTQNAGSSYNASGVSPQSSTTSNSSGTISNNSSGSHSHTVQTHGASNDHTHGVSGTTDSTGAAGANANLQPYVVVHMWLRTA